MPDFRARLFILSDQHPFLPLLDGEIILATTTFDGHVGFLLINDGSLDPGWTGLDICGLCLFASENIRPNPPDQFLRLGHEGAGQLLLIFKRHGIRRPTTDSDYADGRHESPTRSPLTR